jgi:hypothetical protein
LDVRKRKLHSVGRHNLYSSAVRETKLAKIRLAVHVAHAAEIRHACRILFGNLKRISHLGNLCVDGRDNVKACLIVRYEGGDQWLGSCEYGMNIRLP